MYIYIIFYARTLETKCKVVSICDIFFVKTHIFDVFWQNLAKFMNEIVFIKSILAHF